MISNFIKRLIPLILISLAINTPVSAQSPSSQAPQAGTALPDKEGMDYFSFGLALNDFRSVHLVLVEVSEGVVTENIMFERFPMTAQTYSMSLTYGTYITDMFKTELRYGTGIRSDTFRDNIEVDFNYYFNWYIGATHPVTNYLNAYFLYGISFYDADVTW
jgi:hypothetical protein